MLKTLRKVVLSAALMIGLAGLTEAQNPPATPQNPPAQDPKEQPASDPNQPKAKPVSGKVLVPSGTRLPLVLHNAITTRNSKKGDPIYLETLFPVIIDGHVVIPAGSYVAGDIVETKRAGKVKGKAELLVRLNTIIMPNGYTVDFNAIPTGAGTGGNEQVEEEGRIKGDTDKGSDVGTVVKGTIYGGAIGGGVGGAAGGAGGARTGSAIGLGAGAAIGLMTVLLTRGPDIELPRGTTLDIVLDRPLYLEADKVQFTDPGRASTLAGPPNRQPVRNRVPF